MSDEWFPYLAFFATIGPVMILTYLFTGDPTYSLLSGVFVMVGLRELREVEQ